MAIVRYAVNNGTDVGAVAAEDLADQIDAETDLLFETPEQLKLFLAELDKQFPDHPYGNGQVVKITFEPVELKD